MSRRLLTHASRQPLRLLVFAPVGAHPLQLPPPPPAVPDSVVLRSQVCALRPPSQSPFAASPQERSGPRDATPSSASDSGTSLHQKRFKAPLGPTLTPSLRSPMRCSRPLVAHSLLPTPMLVSRVSCRLPFTDVLLCAWRRLPATRLR